MVYLIGIPLVAILAALQSTLMTQIHFLDGRPDLVLLAIVGWSLTGRSEEAMAFGLAGGILLDLYSGLPLGYSAIWLILIAYLISYARGRFWESHILLPLGVMLIASALCQAGNIGGVLLIGHAIDFAGAAARVALPSTFLNLVFILPVVQLAASISEAMTPPQVTV
jgi:rod shape-determining protein MreD